MNQELKLLEQKAGLVFMTGASDYQDSPAAQQKSAKMAMDAQSPLIGDPSAGLLAFMGTYIDPKLIEACLSPLAAVEVSGAEVKKGDWVTHTAAFPTIQLTGTVATYDDYSNAGSADFNATFPQRQSFHYQTQVLWGAQELERWGLGKIDALNKKNMAATRQLSQFQNTSYLLGVAGLQNYGILNDPSLNAAIAPTPKVIGPGNTWQGATVTEIIADINKMYTQLQSQSLGLIRRDHKMTLAMSYKSESYLSKLNTPGVPIVNVFDLIKQLYPNIKLVIVPEYETLAGEVVQLIVNEYQGQSTVEMAFTEKLRAFPIEIHGSYSEQKMMQGTWGAIIYRPMFIVTMLGV